MASINEENKNLIIEAIIQRVGACVYVRMTCTHPVVCVEEMLVFETVHWRHTNSQHLVSTVGLHVFGDSFARNLANSTVQAVANNPTSF